jgi:hypothetical protein
MDELDLSEALKIINDPGSSIVVNYLSLVTHNSYIYDAGFVLSK